MHHPQCLAIVSIWSFVEEGFLSIELLMDDNRDRGEQHSFPSCRFLAIVGSGHLNSNDVLNGDLRLQRSMIPRGQGGE